MCLVGSFKFLPPDPQAFQSMMGSHKFSPNKGRCLDWRLSSLTVGIPDSFAHTLKNASCPSW